MTTLRVATALGSFRVLLHDGQAPKTCRYFSELARGGGLDGTSIFRIVSGRNHAPKEPCPIHIVQMGRKGESEEEFTALPHECTARTGLKHTKWTVSAARFDVDRVYGSFFVCMRDEPSLDYGGSRQPDGQGFAAFGRVVSGFEALEAAYLLAEAEELMTLEVPIHTVLVEP